MRRNLSKAAGINPGFSPRKSAPNYERKVDLTKIDAGEQLFLRRQDRFYSENFEKIEHLLAKILCGEIRRRTDH